MNSKRGRWPAHGYIGSILVAVFWFLNWSLGGTRTSWCFFPLWLGYSLLVDAVACRLEGSSLLTRSPGRYILLFPLSAICWWFFELLNLRIGNWSYPGREGFSTLHFAIFATVSFSTVMPAVFGTTGLLSLVLWRTGDDDKGEGSRPWTFSGRDHPWIELTSGAVLLVVMLVWPKYLFPLAWIAPLLMIDGINCLTGRRTIGSVLRGGGVKEIVSCGAGALVCGLFWELWNFYSFPKWIYHIPFVDFLRIFEMPLLGYGGYIPFGLELFSFASLAFGSSVAFETRERGRLLW